jgi:DNA-binding GntR family transcriptional regulator
MAKEKRNPTSSSALGSKSSKSSLSNGASGHDPTKTDKAYQAIKRAIVKGELAAGSFLSEGDVIRKYGVGRTPFREACNRLIHEGLLEVVPRRGYMVPELSFHDVRDLFELRAVLESAMIQLATVRASHEDIGELARLAAEVPKRHKNGTSRFEAVIDANRRFHLKLAEATRNRELERLLASVLERTERVMFIELQVTKFNEDAFKAIHEPIIEAIKKRDVNAAREALLHDIAQAQDATFGRLLRGPELGLKLKR